MTTDNELIRTDIDAYLAKYQNKELLRFVAVGSVDDGKSTLIGRLLFDTENVPTDQLQAIERASKMEGGGVDLSLLTDGLTAEREQGITIDVAYRYFATDKRKFIIADTPGHVQYTRNMVTGASTANVALILIDARQGVLEQSRRHGYLASLLGIPHLAVCVNKMDLVDYGQERFEEISADFRKFTDTLGFDDVAFFPISALEGENCVERQGKTPWYEGPTVLEYLEEVPVAAGLNFESFRYPIQYVLRPNLDYRGFAAEVASGVVKKGDEILTLPSGKKSKVKAIDTYDGELDEAHTPQSVVIRLEDEIDSSRGDMLVHPGDLPSVSRTVKAHLVWMHEKPLDTQKSYILKHTTQSVRAEVGEIHFKKDMATLDEVPAETLGLNDIALVTLQCHRALYFDAYRDNRATGSFILIDSLTNATVASGMIAEGNAASAKDLGDAMSELRKGSAMAPKSQVSPSERQERFGQKGATVWLTGLPGSGRWTLAYALERRLFDLGRTCTVISPDRESLEGIVSAARATTDAGLITVSAFPAADQEARDQLRERIGDERVVMVFVNTDPELCKERRPNADTSEFTAPEHADVEVDLANMRVDAAVAKIIALLEERGQFG